MGNGYGKHVKSNSRRCEHHNRKVIKKQLLEQYGYFCTYCHKPYCILTLDHIVPLSKGGDNKKRNCALACINCNRDKGALRASEWPVTANRVTWSGEKFEKLNMERPSVQ